MARTLPKIIAGMYKPVDKSSGKEEFLPIGSWAYPGFVLENAGKIIDGFKTKGAGHLFYRKQGCRKQLPGFFQPLLQMVLARRDSRNLLEAFSEEGIAPGQLCSQVRHVNSAEEHKSELQSLIRSSYAVV